MEGVTGEGKKFGMTVGWEGHGRGSGSNAIATRIVIGGWCTGLVGWGLLGFGLRFKGGVLSLQGDPKGWLSQPVRPTRLWYAAVHHTFANPYHEDDVRHQHSIPSLSR